MDKDMNNPYFTFGALLPDLVRGFSKIYNQIDKNYSSSIYEHQSIYLGIKRHLQTDEVFHNLPSFHEACDLVDNLFKKSKVFHLPKSFFVAHILVELLIDKHIVNNNETIAQKFYQELKVLDNNMLITYCESIHFLEFESVFLPRIDVFIKNKYAFKLNHNESIFNALNKICFERLQFKPTNLEKNEILRIIDQSEQLLNSVSNIILEQTKQKLNYD